MKKTLLSLLVFMLLLPCSAYASGPWHFWFESQCVSPSVSTYGYSQQYQQMDSNKTTVYIRYYIAGEGANAGLTNLMGIHEYGSAGRPPMGLRWSASGMSSELSVSLQKDHSYAPCGKANTKYRELYGLTKVRFEGHWSAN